MVCVRRVEWWGGVVCNHHQSLKTHSLVILISSKCVRPNEFLWDGVLRNLSQNIQIRSLLKVDIEAITETDFLTAHEDGWLDSKRISNLSTTLFETSK